MSSGFEGHWDPVEAERIERIQESWTEFLGQSLSTLRFGLCILVRACLYSGGNDAHFQPVISLVMLWIQELPLLHLSSLRLVLGKGCWLWPEHLHLGSIPQQRMCDAHGQQFFCSTCLNPDFLVTDPWNLGRRKALVLCPRHCGGWVRPTVGSQRP